MSNYRKILLRTQSLQFQLLWWIHLLWCLLISHAQATSLAATERTPAPTQPSATITVLPAAHAKPTTSANEASTENATSTLEATASSPLTTIVSVVVILILVLGGGFVYYWLIIRDPNKEKGDAPKAANDEQAKLTANTNQDKDQEDKATKLSLIRMKSVIGKEKFTESKSGLSAKASSKTVNSASILSQTKAPTKTPSHAPTKTPTHAPTKTPKQAPTKTPTHAPTKTPKQAPTKTPKHAITKTPKHAPTRH